MGQPISPQPISYRVYQLPTLVATRYLPNLDLDGCDPENA